MNRLVKKDEYGFEAVCENCPKHGMCSDSSDCKSVLAEKLFAYEDTGLTPQEITPRLCELTQADHDGRVVVLPCKVGAIVYRVVNDAHPHITKDKVCELQFSDRMDLVVELLGGRLICSEKFGKTVFLTRAEAEAALKGDAPNE